MMSIHNRITLAEYRGLNKSTYGSHSSSAICILHTDSKHWVLFFKEKVLIAWGYWEFIIMAKSMFFCTVNTVDAAFFVMGLVFVVVVVVYVRITYQRCAVHF